MCRTVMLCSFALSIDNEGRRPKVFNARGRFCRRRNAPPATDGKTANLYMDKGSNRLASRLASYFLHLSARTASSFVFVFIFIFIFIFVFVIVFYTDRKITVN